MKVKAAVAVLSLALAVPILGQGPVGGRGFGGPRQLPGPEVKERPAGREGVPGNGLGRLANALELTAAQIESLHALQQSRRADQEALAAEMRQARDSFRELVEQGTDPTAIGNAVLAQRALAERARAAHEQLMSDFRNLLTTEQREKLAVIESLGGRGGPFGPGRGGPRGHRGPGGQ